MASSGVSQLFVSRATIFQETNKQSLKLLQITLLLLAFRIFAMNITIIHQSCVNK